MNYFSKGFSLSVALTLGLSACMTPGTSPTQVSPGVAQLRPSQAVPVQRHAQTQKVRFRIDLPGGGFQTQQMASAQYAKLEIWNKYTLAAMNKLTPIYADGADENGFVPVNGNQFILGAEVPEGPNWLVTARLYSNNNDQSEIQQLKAAFHLPSETEVVINHRTTVAGRILEVLQVTNSPLIMGYEPDGTVSNPQFQIPIQIASLQAFADAFTGVDSNPVPAFPQTEPGGNDPELQLPLSNALVRFLRIEELNAEGDEGMALPPPVSMADIDFFKIADDLSDGTIQADHTLTGSTLQLTAQSGQNADPAHYRFPLFLAGRKQLQQRDSTGGTLALNPVNNRLFVHNRVLDVTVRDAQETIQSVELLGGGQFGAMAARNDLDRIDSAYPALGMTKASDDTSCGGDPGAQPAVFVMSRAYNTPGNLEGNTPGTAAVHALRQDNLQTLWTYDFNDVHTTAHPCDCMGFDPGTSSVLNMNRTRFVPVLDREGEGCAQTDVVYIAFNGVGNDTASRGGRYKGIFKLRDGKMVAYAPFQKYLGANPINNENDHNGNALPVPSSQLNFTSGGALSEKLYTDAIKDADGNVTGQTNPSKRLFVLLGAQNNETVAPELIVVDVDENNPEDEVDQSYYGNLRRLRFPLPQGEMLHENSSPVIAQMPNGDEVVYFSAYKLFNTGGNNFDSEGYIYAYHPASRQLAKVYTTDAQMSVTGQTNNPPTIASIGGVKHLYVANDYGQVYSLRPGASWNAALTQNWKTQVGRTRPPLMLFGSPDVVKRTDGSLTLYIASSTVDGRIYELNPQDGSLRSQMFPGGFFSSGTAVHDGYMYVTTRSGNYGDFTYLRSLKIDAQGLAGKTDAPWPKVGGNHANNGNAIAPVF